MKLRVEYIKRPYKDKVYSYPFLVSSYRNENGKPRNKVIQSLSHLPDYVIDAIDASLRSEKRPKTVPIETIKYLDSLPFGDTWAVYSLMKSIGIIDAIELLPEVHKTPIIASIVDRVINPKPYSKRALFDAYEGSAIHRILMDNWRSLNYWYIALESLYRCQTEIEKKLFPENAGKLFLYDITSSYFEGECCPLAFFGYDRDGKKGKKQIVIGLLTGHSGRPIAVRVFKGNTNDQSTVIDQINQLKSQFNISDLIFVGDRGMIVRKKIEDIESDYPWVKYITAIKRSEMMALVEDETHPIQIGLFDQKNLAEVIEGGKRYILCHNPFRKSQDGMVRKRLLDKTEEKLKSIENSVSQGRLKAKDKIAKRFYTWINKWNMGRFFNVSYDEGSFFYSRNEEEIKRYSVLDGCYVIVSNVDKKDMETEEIHAKYKDLKYVEQAFRTLKSSDLFVRPIRHWNPDRVKGHVFMCMLAYLVIWEAKQRLKEVLERDHKNRKCEGNSLREVWDSLSKITIGRIKIGGINVEQIGTIKRDHRKILNLLGAPLNKKAQESLSLKNWPYN